MAESTKPLSEASRIALLKKRVEAARKEGAPTQQVPFRDDQVHLPRIKIPADFPRYRLQSGRTHRKQAEYIEQHDLSSDFFADPESEEAQLAQHQILLSVIDEEGLRADLAERAQLFPLVLTKDGYIVDGNRRTAALRHKGEEQLDAVVLPDDADAVDLYETELELQMARETKADYSWIDEALHVRYGIDELDEPIEKIAKRMRMSKDDVNELLARIELVDLYLDWLGHPDSYHLVGRDQTLDEQSFREIYLRERRQRFQQLPTLHKRAVLEACFAVIRAGGGYKDIRGVADHSIQRLADVTVRVRDADELPDDLRDRFDEPVAVAPEVGGDGQGQDLLGELADAAGVETVPEGAEILNVIGNADNASVIGPILSDVAADLTDRESERDKRALPLKNVRRALKLLRDVTVDSSTVKRGEIARTLAELIEETERLEKQVEAASQGNE
ncbi:MAG TPA: hypothetical protein VFM51_06115 [Solirubrobacterales bacterium]|nr:hypothetical protein [Solirubrobacterales bacterium]